MNTYKTPTWLGAVNTQEIYDKKLSLGKAYKQTIPYKFWDSH